jgi:hypothetical protein
VQFISSHLKVSFQNGITTDASEKDMHKQVNKNECVESNSSEYLLWYLNDFSSAR